MSQNNELCTSSTLVAVTIAYTTKPVGTKWTNLSKNNKHHQKTSAKLACILALVGIKCPKVFWKENRLLLCFFVQPCTKSTNSYI